MENDQIKILTVDDDPISLRVVSAMLTKAGYDVSTASSGRNALALLKKNASVDLIVSDVMMPDIDGFGLLQQVRSSKHTSRIPVILCTCLNDQVSVIKGVKLGATDYLSKPVKSEILIEKVKKVLGQTSGAVLIVDSEDVIRRVLVRVIGQDGYKTMDVRSCEEALEIIKESNLSLVITNTNMPGMSGVEFLGKIKSSTPDIPVMLITGQDGFNQSDAIAAGADGFITKPFRNVEVLARINKLLD